VRRRAQQRERAAAHATPGLTIGESPE
jgi:hypothetical protein